MSLLLLAVNRIASALVGSELLRVQAKSGS